MNGIIRRRMFGGETSSPFNDWLLGYKTGVSGNKVATISDSAYMTSPLYGVNEDDVIELHYGTITGGTIITCVITNSAKDYIDWWTARSNPEHRTISIAQGGTFIIFNIKQADKDDCYAINKTTGKYIYKGANVK